MSNFQLSEYQLQSLGRATAKHVKQFFKNPENERKFEEWFIKTHGCSYVDYKERRNLLKGLIISNEETKTW